MKCHECKEWISVASFMARETSSFGNDKFVSKRWIISRLKALPLDMSNMKYRYKDVDKLIKELKK